MRKALFIPSILLLFTATACVSEQDHGDHTAKSTMTAYLPCVSLDGISEKGEESKVEVESTFTIDATLDDKHECEKPDGSLSKCQKTVCYPPVCTGIGRNRVCRQRCVTACTA